MQPIAHLLLPPCERTLSAFGTTWCNSKRIARQCAYVYWLQLCEGIRRSADCGNVCGLIHWAGDN
ncbi:hypothetical protein DPMN_070555 [Dreissena polymorpha]|uniref:Uncharacterized protein n=1 Tax=Dreissena polymorpha TaxID=45954 RepID=A0A9D3Z5B5_DREPO|nr:hypothetical protein DPMN_070555 [Dreissena polymorpha]